MLRKQDRSTPFNAKKAWQYRSTLSMLRKQDGLTHCHCLESKIDRQCSEGNIHYSSSCVKGRKIGVNRQEVLIFYASLKHVQCRVVV